MCRHCNLLENLSVTSTPPLHREMPFLTMHFQKEEKTLFQEAALDISHRGIPFLKTSFLPEMVFATSRVSFFHCLECLFPVGREVCVIECLVGREGANGTTCLIEQDQCLA